MELFRLASDGEGGKLKRFLIKQLSQISQFAPIHRSSEKACQFLQAASARHRRLSMAPDAERGSEPSARENADIPGEKVQQQQDQQFCVERKDSNALHTTRSTLPEFEVDFKENDPENPRCWPLWYRCWCIFCVSYSTWVATVYSTSYTSSAPGLTAEFGVSTTVVTLGMTSYLLGLATGTFVVAPLSELYGRRVLYISGLTIWAILIVPCGVAKSLATIIACRYFGYVQLRLFATASFH